MKEISPDFFHKLYGVRKPRTSYMSKDLLDYALMLMLTAAVIGLVYGPGHPLAIAGYVLCAIMLVVFPIRHGFELSVPLILRRPQDVVYMVAYKIGNMKLTYLFAVLVLLLENYLVYLTPQLPHNVELMREIGWSLLYLHLAALTLYRTAVLAAHLKKRDHVEKVLSETTWKRKLSRQSNVTIEILHAYFTGLLTHVVLLAPWFLIISLSNFSILLLPVICVVNLVTHARYMKRYSDWFYRDHWLGHNSELEFVYLHGSHHDAIPSGLIGVSGNGFLEGFLRHTLGHPTPFYNPVVAFLLYTFEVWQDINNHQFIPGVFPRLTREFHQVFQHSTHHFGSLEPYSIGVNFDQPGISEASRKRARLFPPEALNSIKLDEKLTGFTWHNPKYRSFLELFDRYQGG